MVMKTTPPIDNIGNFVPARARRRVPARPRTYLGPLRIIGTWIERSRQRRALADLDDRLLTDVGLTRADVVREVANPFWRWIRGRL